MFEDIKYNLILRKGSKGKELSKNDVEFLMDRIHKSSSPLNTFLAMPEYLRCAEVCEMAYLRCSEDGLKVAKETPVKSVRGVTNPEFMVKLAWNNVEKYDQLNWDILRDPNYLEHALVIKINYANTVYKKNNDLEMAMKICPNEEYLKVLENEYNIIGGRMTQLEEEDIDGYVKELSQIRRDKEEKRLAEEKMAEERAEEIMAIAEEVRREEEKKTEVKPESEVKPIEEGKLEDDICDLP